VTTLPFLYVRMLRHRVAAMVWTFMLLAPAYRVGLERFSWEYVWAAVALASSYVAATTVNDVADREIDALNHPRDRGRPLVSGDARERDLYRLHVAAALLAIVAAALVGIAAVGLTMVSLAIGWTYSLAPARLSHRTWLAPVALAAAYVAVPYGLGLTAAGVSPSSGDALFCAGLSSLFVSRIVLKDFRDRRGDAAYGKPTMLLRFGKTATCATSLVALALGDALLLLFLRPPLVFGIVLQAFVAAIGSRLLALWRAADPRAEQLAIGLGARMGNGLLLSVLAWLVLVAHQATPAEGTAFVAALALVFWLGYGAVLSRPADAVIAYKS
jgi:4-hydroxybenzoate polyprenyltransferase